MPQSFSPFHSLFSHTHQLAFIAGEIDGCLRAKGSHRHRAQTAFYLHHSVPCAQISWEERRATVLCNSLEIFPVSAQSKLPFGDTCLSPGYWEHSLQISLDASP